MDDHQEQPQHRLLQEPRTTEQARAILDQIRFDHGIYDDNDSAELARTSESWQQKVTESGKKLSKKLGVVAKAVSTQHDTVRFCFIHELIKIADNALHSSCTRGGQVPNLTFTIRPTEIIVESNEDSFSVANVIAMSAATRGVKKLGFKSVFAISDLVRVQSGLWSFEFRYPAGDSGLGMIAPYWTDLPCLDHNIGSRITLRLADSGPEFRRELTKALEDVPETALLFLRNLQKLTFRFEGQDGQLSVRTIQRQDFTDSVDKTIFVDVNGTRNEFLYKMRTGLAYVPGNDQLDEYHKPAWRATVVKLVFPVNNLTKTPRINDEGQHLFTPLPMKRIAQFPFIIQANFDTSSNRESVTDTQRNRVLRAAVAQVFASSVERFCRDCPALRYTWTRFLPDHQTDDFWKPLRAEIQDALKNKALLISCKGPEYHEISKLRMVTSVFRHQGKPLFQRPCYISEEYDQTALAALQTLGLPVLSKEEMLACVESDLANEWSLSSPEPTITSTELSNSWHTALTHFLALIICPDKQLKSRLAQLPILPVSTRFGIRWKSPPSISQTGPVFFPRILDDDNSPVIDPELGLLTLHPDACAEHARRKFYSCWDVRHADTRIVCDAVIQKNTTSKAFRLTDRYVQDFAILFWQGFEGTSKARPLYAIDTRANIIRSDRLYLSSDTEYSTSQLLSKIDHPLFGFLHQQYFKHDYGVQRHININSQRWHEWVAKVAGVRVYPELSSKGFSGLSPIFLEIIRKAPSKVVGALKAHWKSYRNELADNPSIIDELKSAKVRCRTGKLQRLCNTILPTGALLSASRAFGVEHKMPFLDISPDSLASGDWSFIAMFGVCMNLTLQFRLNALEHLADLSPSKDGIGAHAAAIYESIGSVATFEDKKHLKNFFATHAAIFARGRWSAMNDCVWKAPACQIGRIALGKRYAPRPRAANLFCNLLDIENATHEDIIAAIEAKKASAVDFTAMAMMYKELDVMVDWGTMKKAIRTKFEEQALIFDGRGWKRLSSCVWNSAIKMRETTVLKALYSEELQGFFNERLGVESLSLTMALEELIRTASDGSPNPEEVKAMLREISSMLSAQPWTNDVESLIKRFKLMKLLPATSDRSTPLLSAR